MLLKLFSVLIIGIISFTVTICVNFMRTVSYNFSFHIHLSLFIADLFYHTNLFFIYGMVYYFGTTFLLSGSFVFLCARDGVVKYSLRFACNRPWWKCYWRRHCNSKDKRKSQTLIGQKHETSR